MTGSVWILDYIHGIRVSIPLHQTQAERVITGLLIVGQYKTLGFLEGFD